MVLELLPFLVLLFFFPFFFQWRPSLYNNMFFFLCFKLVQKKISTKKPIIQGYQYENCTSLAQVNTYSLFCYNYLLCFLLISLVIFTLIKFLIFFLDEWRYLLLVNFVFIGCLITTYTTNCIITLGIIFMFIFLEFYCRSHLHV